MICWFSDGDWSLSKDRLLGSITSPCEVVGLSKFQFHLPKLLVLDLVGVNFYCYCSCFNVLSIV